MLLKCIAIDDELPALELIKNYAGRMADVQLLHCFQDAVSAGEFLRNNPVDLIFVDINMPDINGIELVKALPQKPQVVFTTAYRKFAYEGFELDAADYLLKPIEFERFKKGVLKAMEIIKARSTPASPVSEECIFVRSEYRMVKVNLQDIAYIEGLEDYIRIHFYHTRPLLTLSTMKAFMEKLPAEKFLRIHRSYIIPFYSIETVMNKKVVLQSGATLPVSDTYAPELASRLKK
jgi:two-component system, LytTR family, response regulator